jgi:photosystem II stability/assembly factor-like uncharacterized protein
MSEPPTCDVAPPVAYAGPATIPSEQAAAPGPYAWKNVTIKGGGFVSGIVTSRALPGLVFARTDVGGVYRSDPVNRRWTPVTDWIGRADGNLTGIESVAADPVDPSRVYIAAGQYLTAGNGWILSSTDMGRTWARHAIAAPMGGNVDGRSMGERLAIDPNRPNILYFGSRNAGLWKSTDHGQSWARVDHFPTTGAMNGGAGSGGDNTGTGYGLTFVVFDPRARAPEPDGHTLAIYVGVGLAGGDSGLYRSADGGDTWEIVDGDPRPTGMMPHHAVLDGCGNLYLAYNDRSGPNSIMAGAVWRYGTMSGRWTEVSPPKQGGGFGGIAADPVRGGTLIVTTIDLWQPDKLYRTTDGGQSWAAFGGAARRDDAGAKWLYWHRADITATGWMGDVEIDPFNPSRALYITGQGIWSSDDVTAADAAAPTSWRFDNDGLEETVPLDLVSPPSGPRLLSGLGDIAGFRHEDLDVSPPEGMFGDPIFGNTSSLDFAERDPNIVARVGTSSAASGARGAYSTDGGKTWTAFAGAPEATGMMTPPPRPSQGAIAVSADGATFVWAPRDGRPSYSSDRGATWTACAGFTSGTRVAADRVNAAMFYANGGNRTYVSTDGGATFVPACPMGAAGCLAASGRPRPVFGIEGDVWLPGGSGLFHSQDAGASWTQVAQAQVGNTAAVGFGMPAPGQSYPAVYASALVNGAWGVHRSDDAGATWQRIDDPEHQFGYVNHVAGDPRQYGRVYIGTGGRGVFYGDPR